MITTYKEAIDSMFGHFFNTWKSRSPLIVGYVPEVYWQGVELPESPDLSKVWAHVSQQTANTDPAGFGDAIDRRYTTVGVLTIDIFAPRPSGMAMDHGRRLAEEVRRAFEGSRTGGVWYRNCTIIETGQTDNFAVFRVQCDYEYTEQGR